VTAICLALPEATRCDHGAHAAFTIRKKTFAYFLNDHHGDGIVSVCTKALPGENNALLAAHPRKFYLPAYIGPRGWIGLRLDRGKIDWNEVRDHVTISYLQVAPRRLASQVESALR
jgi:predicted DNA-binding protein (MmcQ/YjbR family)